MLFLFYTVSEVYTISKEVSNRWVFFYFAFYTETVKGPPQYIGKKTHFAVATIPADVLEIEYTAPQVMVYVPEEYKYSYDINMGLVISPEERKYNHRTFDIEYRYYNK